MKYIATLATLLISFSAFSKVDFQTVKVADGTSAYCNSKKDFYENPNGVYRAKAQSVKLINDNTLSIDLTLVFLKCINEDNRFGFTYASPYEQYAYQTLNFKSDYNTVRVTPLNISLKGYKDGVYNLLVDSKVPEMTEGQVTMTIEVPVEQILDKNQKTITLSDGKIITGSIDLFLQKTMSYYVEQSEKKEITKTLSYGAFRLHVQLQEVNGQMTVRLAK